MPALCPSLALPGRWPTPAPSMRFPAAITIDSSTDTSTVSFTRAGNGTLDSSTMEPVWSKIQRHQRCRFGGIDVEFRHVQFLWPPPVQRHGDDDVQYPVAHGQRRGIRSTLPARTWSNSPRLRRLIGNTTARLTIAQPILPYAIFAPAINDRRCDLRCRRIHPGGYGNHFHVHVDGHRQRPVTTSVALPRR